MFHLAQCEIVLQLVSLCNRNLNFIETVIVSQVIGLRFITSNHRIKLLSGGRRVGQDLQKASIVGCALRVNQIIFSGLQQLASNKRKTINTKSVLMKDLTKIDEQHANPRQSSVNQQQRQKKMRAYRLRFLERIGCRMQKLADKMEETRSEGRMEHLQDYETDHSSLSADYFHFQCLEQ